MKKINTAVKETKGGYMKTVVITGSARGLGLEMAKVFKENNVSVIISDLNEDALVKSEEELNKIKSSSVIKHYVCDVTKTKDIESLIKFAKDEFGKIDIWINNAGVNHVQNTRCTPTPPGYRRILRYIYV